MVAGLKPLRLPSRGMVGLLVSSMQQSVVPNPPSAPWLLCSLTPAEPSRAASSTCQQNNFLSSGTHPSAGDVSTRPSTFCFCPHLPSSQEVSAPWRFGCKALLQGFRLRRFGLDRTSCRASIRTSCPWTQRSARSLF